MDFIRGKRCSFTCYFPKLLKIHRTKTEKSNDLYNRHLTLKPEIEIIKNINEMNTYDFRLPDYKVDLVISGLGFVSVNCPNGNVKIHVPKGVGVFIREALI